MKDYRGVRIFQSMKPGDGPVKAAIAVFDFDLDVIQCPEFTTPNISVVKIRTSAWEILVVSFYFEPDPEHIEPYLEQLNRIGKEFSRNILIGGDSNAKSSWWGSPIVDDRGEAMAGALEDLGLQVLNDNTTPTFFTVRGEKTYSSFIDVTACATELLNLVEDWCVDEGMTSSDHNTILFKIKMIRSKGINISRSTRIYNSRKANWNHFHLKMTQLLEENKMNSTNFDNVTDITNLENKINTYINLIIKASNKSIPKINVKNGVNLPWWSEELAALKNDVATKKRRIRWAAKVRRKKVVAEYLQSKEKYELEAKKAQIGSWKAFCEKQDREGVWEGIYRVIGRTTKRHEDLPLVINGKVLSPKGSAAVLAETFYPMDKKEDDTAEQKLMREEAEQVNGSEHDIDHDPPFTSPELMAAVESFNPKKAPGSDGLTADICKRAIYQDPGIFLSLANRCLELGHFPNSWKEATVVILRKPGKESYTDPKSYRPIGLLPVMGKILEKMVVARIKWHILPRLSSRQYGFMPQRSTEDSLYDLVEQIREKLRQKKLITLVSLDIEGAFDCAWWPAIRLRLAEERCPINVRRVIDSYLTNRRVRVRYAGEEVIKDTTKGCVQGSIGGPILWNILLDTLLKGLQRRGDYGQAFADDVVLLFDGDTAVEVQRRANDALAYVREWGIKHKLKFAPHKTKAMLLTRKLKFDTPHLRMGGVDIAMSKEIKLLGLWIDDKLTFNTHATEVCRKALNLYKQLSRAARISWGLHPEVIRTIYMAVVEPVVSYAAGVWAPATKKLGIQKQLNAVQRGFAQKLCKAYRTVSLNSGLVLAGILPLDLRIQEAATLYEVKRGVPQPVLGDRVIERRIAFAKTLHPADHMTLQFICLNDEQDVATNSTQAVQIFTDGSKIEGKVGASLSFWSNGAEIKCLKLKLPSHCSVYQAELLAICRATSEILKRPELTFGIFTDSRSSLDTIVRYCSLHPLAVQARCNLKDCEVQNKKVQLFWIKAHAGLDGNERADQLAKDAALKLKTRPDYDLCPVSFVKRQIRLDTLDEWNRRYRSGDTAAVTKMFLPDAIQSFKIIRKLTPNGRLTQLMTGHGGFSEYLHRFKCKENPSCICEPGTIETVQHILLECPVHGIARYNLEQSLGIKLTTENICEIIRDDLSRDIFIEYCMGIVNKVIDRNKTR